MNAQIQEDIIPATEVPRDMNGYGNIEGHMPKWWWGPVLIAVLTAIFGGIGWVLTDIGGLQTSVARLQGQVSAQYQSLNESVQMLVQRSESKRGS